jgi:hypothetical protein
MQIIRHASAVALTLVCNASPLFGQSAPMPVAEFNVQASAEIHKSPSTASPVIGKAPRGAVLEVRRNLGSWVEVPWPNADTGLAFVHVNTGTIKAGAASPVSSDAKAAVEQIAAVAAAADAIANASGQQAAPTRTYVSLPMHRLGIGALMDASEPKVGVTTRTWWGRGFGLQVNLAPTQLESVDGQLVGSTQFAPSVLYSLPDAVTTGVWLRPYIGAGPRMYWLNQENGFGYEGFGGAEATFAGLPQLAISADVAYRWSRPSIGGFAPRQIGFSLSGHWYVR